MKIFEQRLRTSKRYAVALVIAGCAFLMASCGVYSFKDVSIDYTKIKTIKVGFIENRARYINPQLSPQLTTRLQQKITSTTKLTSTANDEANLVVNGAITDYSVTTAAITTQQSLTNRLTVTVHMVVKDNVNNKTDEFDATRNFDFSANLSLDQAQAQLQEDILKNVTDEIFNHIFSNW